MIRRSLGYAAMVVFLLSAFWGATARAQSRINDKDLARLMQNVKDDAQPFRKSFANALKKSTIRGTSREKDARGLANTFADQSKRALETFEHKRKAEDQVAAMVDTAGQIGSLVNELGLNPAVTAQWEKLRTELHQVAQAFGVQEGPGTATGSAP
jgi:FtsZ-interacting cell division protein ZipA